MYNVAGWETLKTTENQERFIGELSSWSLSEYSNDSDCRQQIACRAELSGRAFDRRLEVSADARYIAGRIVKELMDHFCRVAVRFGHFYYAPEVLPVGGLYHPKWGRASVNKKYCRTALQWFAPIVRRITAEIT
jgi:hypothetical protein